MGLTGDFEQAEDSDRSRALTAQWERAWPDAQPIGHLLRGRYGERCVRFHSLPKSKRYADSTDEYEEIIRRHRTVLSELLAGRAVDSLILVAEDWGPRDLASGWSRQLLPGVWPWRKVPGDEPEELSYLWVETGLASDRLDVLLTAAADGQGHFLIADAELEWLYHPYDGGADIILPTTAERDALRDRHAGWLSAHPAGL